MTLLASLLGLALLAATLAWTARRPEIGVHALLVLTFLRPQDGLPLLAAARPVALLAAVTLLATVWPRRRIGPGPEFGHAALASAARSLVPMAAVLAVTGLGVLASEYATLAARAWVELAKDAVLLALVVTHVDSSRRLAVALWVIGTSVAALAARSIGIGLALGYPGSYMIRRGGIGGPSGAGYESSLVDPNNFARLLVLALPLWWACGRAARGGAGRALAAGGALITVGALFFTFSRSGFVAFAAVGAVALLSVRPRWKGVAALLLAVALFVVFAPRKYRERVVTAARPFSDVSMGIRLAIWERGFEMAAERPLLGTGLGTFRARHEDITGRERTAHNVFVEVLAETGALGLAAYLLLLGVVGWRLLRVVGRPPPAGPGTGTVWLPAAAGSILLSMFGFLVAGLALSRAHSMFLLVPLALGVAVARIASREAPGPPAPDGAAAAAAGGHRHG